MVYIVYLMSVTALLTHIHGQRNWVTGLCAHEPICLEDDLLKFLNDSCRQLGLQIGLPRQAIRIWPMVDHLHLALLVNRVQLEIHLEVSSKALESFFGSRGI